MELTSVQNVKRYLKLSASANSDDGLLQMLVDSANDAITSAISRNILSAQYTEARNGTGTGTIMLANFPVTAVGAVSITAPRATFDAAAPSAPLTLGVDFTFTPYAIKLFAGCFPRGVANVQIEYTAGYASVPADLVHVATKWAALRYREFDRLGQQSTSLQGQSVTFVLDELTPDMLAIVNRYQSPIPIIAQPLSVS